ncbi:RNA-directed DNA polymerase, eukaryota [Tanacetum coccineum]
MSFTGFSQKWISWIRGCLSSARTSILVNGSPTKELSLKCGLRQGDPLSPFLFLLIMEGLHVAINDATSAGIFRGARVGSLQISHLLFADDAIFLVEFLEVQRLALLTGCNPNTIPFVYLGMPIADSMSKKKGWDILVKRFNIRLSKWKASLLSIGGRSTLLTSVLGALGTYLFSLFPMPKCINNLLESIRAPFFGAWMGRMQKFHGWLGRLPTRWNLSNKGIEIESILCPVCSSSPETVDHILWTCSLATSVWLKTFQWLDLVFPSSLSITKVLEDLDHRHFSKEKKEIVAAVLGVVFWSLWKFRNESIFSRHPPKQSGIMDKILETSFLWFTSRHRKCKISWNNWLRNPLLFSIM